MCHAYSITSSVEALRQLVGAPVLSDNIGYFGRQNGTYPGMLAPIIRLREGLRELATVVKCRRRPASSVRRPRSVRTT